MGAPKGNKYALGCTTSGRPPVYKSPEELQEKIIEYFEQATKLTITGLCLYCGFGGRQSFYDYGDKKEFSYIIKRAQLAIECHYEEKACESSSAGPIFILKNMGWSDRQEIDHTTKGEVIKPVIKFVDGNS